MGQLIATVKTIAWIESHNRNENAEQKMCERAFRPKLVIGPYEKSEVEVV